MKLQNKMMFVATFLALAMPMMAAAAPVGTFSSDLSPSQTFYGDGAVYGNGLLQAPPANNQGEKCLECHQGIPADFNPNVIIPDKRSYLRTGHGNMLKKVTAPPQVWKGANGLPYPTDSVGHVIDWNAGTVDLGGFCDVGGFEGQFLQSTCEATTACTLDASVSPAVYTTSAACTTAGGQWKKGTWTPGSRPASIIYLIGDWMSIDAPDMGIAGGGLSGLAANKFWMADGRTYGTCGSCHTAGYKANNYTRPQPFADYPNFPVGAAAGVGGSWVLDGIQCERCHDATQHFASPFTATVALGASSTALCSQCHLRAAAWEGSANPNAATQPTAYPIGASSTNFGSHLIGKQFLNSPHGRFTGAYAQIANTTSGLYNSHFSDGTCSVAGDFLTKANCEAAGGTWTSFQGGCATCHDVHQTTVVKIYPEGPDEGALPGISRVSAVTGAPEPIRRKCGIDCHASRANFSTIHHSSGEGTPIGDGSDIMEACVTCHMPKPVGGTGLAVHVFRISTDPNYSTFPKAGATTPGICSDPNFTTRSGCLAAGKSWSLVANSAPDETFQKAVWVDLDLACGQCHGGGATGEGAKVLPMTKRQLARFAKNMHGETNRAPTAAISGSPTESGLTVTFQDNSTDRDEQQFNLRISVNWGDGHVGTGQPGGTFQHTYMKAGTYTIRHVAIDTRGVRGFESFKVTLTGE